MAALPTFGGTAVDEIDIGQPGSARRIASPSDALFAANWGDRSVDFDEVVTKFPQQAFSFTDILGLSGFTISWSGKLWCRTNAIYIAIASELNEYLTGATINFATGIRSAVVKDKMKPDKLVDPLGNIVTNKARIISVDWSDFLIPKAPTAFAVIRSLSITFRGLE